MHTYVLQVNTWNTTWQLGCHYYILTHWDRTTQEYLRQGILRGRHVFYSTQKETNTCLQYQWYALNLAILTQCTKPLN